MPSADPEVPAAAKAGEAVPMSVNVSVAPVPEVKRWNPVSRLAAVQSTGEIWAGQVTPVTVYQLGRLPTTAK